MAITNPKSDNYERYATAKLMDYASANFCGGLSGDLEALLGDRCGEMLRLNQGALEAMIHNQTQRQNFWLFSLYQTTFAMPGLPMLPAYRVQTVGLLGRFFTYQAGRMP